MARVADKILPRFRARCRRRALLSVSASAARATNRTEMPEQCFRTFDHFSHADSNARLYHAIHAQIRLVRREVPACPWHRPPRCQICFPSPYRFQTFGGIFESIPWLVNGKQNILSRTKDTSSDIVIADFGMCIGLAFSSKMSHMRVI